MDNNENLYNQLIKLGDMMGDGLHHEPEGKWISIEYKKICKELGLLPKKPKSNNIKKINELMAEKVTIFKCPECKGKVKQTRSGSMRGICIQCGAKYQLLKRKK